MRALLESRAPRQRRGRNGLIGVMARRGAPIGTIGPPFLNAAAVGETSLGARELLDALLALETERGRERPFTGAPRTLDLDLVLWGDLVAEDSHLIVPHPRFRERRFVLEPLVEIAPALVDPVTGRSIRELLERLTGGPSGEPPG